MVNVEDKKKKQSEEKMAKREQISIHIIHLLKVEKKKISGIRSFVF